MTEEEIKDEYNKCMKSFEYFKDNYVKHKRIEGYWKEVVYCIEETLKKKSEESLEIYKKDREEYIKWYNQYCMQHEIR